MIDKLKELVALNAKLKMTDFDDRICEKYRNLKDEIMNQTECREVLELLLASGLLGLSIHKNGDPCVGYEFSSYYENGGFELVVDVESDYTWSSIKDDKSFSIDVRQNQREAVDNSEVN